MPPEPVPWDRKDFFKERRHERLESIVSASRWRDSPSLHGSREFARWGSGDFRRAPAHGKHGGWHITAEENGHGYLPSRSVGKALEDDQPSISRGDGKYGRNCHENRGSFTPREWKGHTWETSNGSLNAAGRLDVNNSDQMSVDNLPHSDIVNAWDQFHLKEQHDNKIGLVNGLSAGQRSERENSLDWKPLKWVRSGSLSSRGSVFSHSSSSKSLGGADSNEGKAELQHKNASPVQSPTVDGAAGPMLSGPFEDTTSRKKPRLGWGEGLAKYERKKVEGPDVCMNKEGTAVCASNIDSNHSQSYNLNDKSPKVVGFSDCVSPVTPSSVACSSSPGIEGNSSGRTVNMDHDMSTFCGSPYLGSQNFLEGFSSGLEKLDINSVVNLGSSLVDLLQTDDASVHSSFVRSSAMNKLLLCKSDVLKALEMTESEIDLHENELKLLKSESKNGFLCPAMSSSVHTLENAELLSELGSNFVLLPRPLPLQVDTADAIVDDCGREVDTGREDIESPGTATSKFVESVSLVKAVSSSSAKCDECPGEVDESEPKNFALSSVDASNEEDAFVSSLREGSLPLKIRNNRIPISNNAGFHTDLNCKLSEAILTENNESANKALEEFNKLLPGKQCDFTGFSNAASWQDSFIKERFARRQRFLRFKERVISLKFKAFQHLWKEDMRVISVRKNRAKAQKKGELSLRTTYGGHQKHRSSVRSRFFSPAGNMSLVPTAEVVNYTSKLLSDSSVKPCREALKMPALILDKKGKMVFFQITSRNGLVEDPLAVEKERTLINPWTPEEKEIFMDKLAVFGKDFKKIATFLDHKTTADCVEFYYKNHKSDCFEGTKKKLDLSKQRKSVTNSTYMLASGKKWNREVNAASLEMLGEASLIAAHVDNGSGSQQMCSGHVVRRGYSDSKLSQVDDFLVERPGRFDLHGNERETVAADVLAGICSSLSPEEMSFCLTSSADHGEGYQEWRYQKMDSVAKGPSTSDVTQYVDDEACSDESSGEMDPGDWTDEEKYIFIQAVSSYGKDFAKIARCVGTRSLDQCKVFFSKARKCLGLDLLYPESCNVGTPVSDDANGGGSDAEDACILETGSTICSDKMGPKIDENSSCFKSTTGSLSVVDLKRDESNPTKCMDLETDLNISDAKDWMGPPESNNCTTVKTLMSDVCGPEVSAVQVSEFDQKSSVESPTIEARKDEVTERGIAMVDSASVGEAVDLGASSLNAVCGREVVGEVSSRNSLEREALFIPKENGFSTTASVAQGSAIIESDKMLVQDTLSSTLDVQASADKQGLKSVGQDDCQHHLSVHPLLNHVESPYIITGYPLPIATKKEMNSDSSCRQLSESLSYCKSDGNLTGQSLTQDCFLQKCNSSNPVSTMSEFAQLSQKNEQIAGYPRGHARSLSDVEEQCGNGDVKLFGTILSHPSSQKMDSISFNHENDERGILYPRQGSKSSNPTLTGHPIADGSTGVLNFDRNNYMGGFETVPFRSYRFWDGNQIQTGFSSLPDSTRLLSMYPAAFVNYPGSISKMGQQPLQDVMKNNERTTNGVAIFCPRGIGANGLLDYQQHWSPDGTKVHPVAVGTRQQQETSLPDIQKRNGYEAVSSSQKQQGRAMVEMNVVGRGGIVVGGPCTGVSDPVAAIKMHYAKTDRYSGHSGSVIRDQEWRGNGNIGS